MRASLVTSLILAAAARAAELAGQYQLSNVREMGSGLLLQRDGRFEFFLSYGAADYWAKGTWQKQDGAVVLNSETGDPKPAFRLVSSVAVKGEGVRVIVTGPGGRPVPNIDVVFQGADGPVGTRTDADGVAEFIPIKGLRSAKFRVGVYQFESEPIAVNPALNEFRFEIDGREITQIRFRNERLEMDGDALVMRRAGSDRALRYMKE